jgi:hypothetical protein
MDATRTSRRTSCGETFQDLRRAAQVHDFVARSISGHATLDMHQHYSSVSALKVRDGLA